MSFPTHFLGGPEEESSHLAFNCVLGKCLHFAWPWVFKEFFLQLRRWQWLVPLCIWEWYYIEGFLGGSVGKESACSAGGLGSILDQEDPLEKEMAPTPVFLPGESPWTEEPGGLQSMGSQRVGQDWATKHRNITERIKVMRTLGEGRWLCFAECYSQSSPTWMTLHLFLLFLYLNTKDAFVSKVRHLPLPGLVFGSVYLSLLAWVVCNV